MVDRPRRVVWTKSARHALEEVLEYIAADSHDGAIRVLSRALEVGESLQALAERGRVVPEVDDPSLRELFVYDYRLLYRVEDDRVVVQAFLHGARDFERWRSQNDF